MWPFETTIQRILSGAALYVLLTSVAIYVHWMWFSDFEMTIGRTVKRTRKPGERVRLHGLALPSSYYERLRKKEEQEKMEKEAAK